MVKPYFYFLKIPKFLFSIGVYRDRNLAFNLKPIVYAVGIIFRYLASLITYDSSDSSVIGATLKMKSKQFVWIITLYKCFKLRT